MTNIKYLASVCILCVVFGHLDQPKSQNSAKFGQTREDNLCACQNLGGVEKSADLFISQFREKLDFGYAFDRLFVSDYVRRMRKANFFSNLNFSEKAINNASDKSLEKAYKALMNYYFLRAVYDMNLPTSTNLADNPLPSDVTDYAHKSKYLFFLVNETDEDPPTVESHKDLTQFTYEYEAISLLFRTHLPGNAFSKNYENNISTIRREFSGIRIQNGYPEFGVREETRVYELSRDLFHFYFVTENNECRVLTLDFET